MKTKSFRRYRRRTAPVRNDGTFFKKQSQETFFGNESHDPFFQSATSNAPAQHMQHIQRKCKKCDEEENKIHRAEDKKEDDAFLQKKGNDTLASSTATSPYVNSLAGKGNILPKPMQQFFGKRMGYNFGHVKIHTDKEAADSAKAINAKAYTTGNHIVFGEGQFQDESFEGKKLVAHELVHVMQQENSETEKNVNRKSGSITEPQQRIMLPPIHLQVKGSKIENTTHNADCNGVSVSGSTSANYSSSGSLSGRPTLATDCSGCTGNDCVVVNSTVVSRFRTAPVVSLPPVPGGLNPCERRTVRAFINGTLNQHEQQHVAAFNTYRGTVSSPISFTGCKADLQAEVQTIHDNVEVPRRQASDNLSAALDANGANVFNITCECPDPTPDAGAK